MKRYFLVFSHCFVLTFSAYSQFEEGQSKIGWSLGVGSSSFECSFGNSISSSSYNFLMLLMLYSHYLIDAFSLEPELILFAMEKPKPTYLILFKDLLTFTKDMEVSFNNIH